MHYRKTLQLWLPLWSRLVSQPISTIKSLLSCHLSSCFDFKLAWLSWASSESVVKPTEISHLVHSPLNDCVHLSRRVCQLFITPAVLTPLLLWPIFKVPFYALPQSHPHWQSAFELVAREWLEKRLLTRILPICCSFRSVSGSLRLAEYSRLPSSC
jgi:hypothetical protein